MASSLKFLNLVDFFGEFSSRGMEFVFGDQRIPSAFFKFY